MVDNQSAASVGGRSLRTLPQRSASALSLASGQNRGRPQITPEERWNMITMAAYHRAQERDFQGGNMVEDWLAAEAEIDAELGTVARGRSCRTR